MSRFDASKKTLIFLILITLIGLFFYSFRLKETQLFRNDPARDTLKILRIWQNKEITLIGPPISFTQHTTREAFLGSVFLYIGLVGMFLAKWDPIGAVLPNILFFTLSIPVFYIITTRLTRSFAKRVIATIIYTISPITVTHARFFWNPNLIIPASVFFWYLVLKADDNKRYIAINFLSAGGIAGVMFNFHYLVIVPLVVYIATLVFTKQLFKGFLMFIGLIIGSLPIIIFELRNNLYLTKALFDSLFQGRGPGNFDLIGGVNNFFGIFWSILGLRQSEIDFPTPFQSPALDGPIILIVTLIMIVIVIARRSKLDMISRTFVPMIGVGILLTVYFSSGNPVRLRYLFSIYPILICLIVEFVWGLKVRLLVYLLLIPIIATSFTIITNQPSLEKSFIRLSLIENICETIVKDNPVGSYNITENLKGDARAMSFRYCVTKDALVKPNDEFSYNNLTSLYVVSQTIDKIYQDNRWEFYASKPWELVETYDFKEVKLFKFTHNEKY